MALNNPGPGNKDNHWTGELRTDDAISCDKVALRKVHLNGLTEHPTDAEDGDVWYRSDTDTFHVKTAAGIKTITVA